MNLQAAVLLADSPDELVDERRLLDFEVIEVVWGKVLLERSSKVVIEADAINFVFIIYIFFALINIIYII